ncbi:MAG: LysE family transporter [Caldilineaceae bacterium]
MSTLILSSMLLGIAFCAPPGAVTAEAIRRGVARGFHAALGIELGSLIGDALWAMIALAGLAVLVQNDTARLGLGAVGVYFLLKLAWGALYDAWQGGMPHPRAVNAQNDFFTGAALSIGNPWAVAFWLGVGASTITNAVAQPETIHFVVFFLAFMAAATLYAFLMAALIAFGRRYINAGFFRVINLACGLFLGYFGLTLFWNVLQEIRL